jgi:uncharacterized protein YjbJ (UPF0337 family)
MTDTRTSGAKNEAKGTVKEVAGKLTGDRSQEVEGKVQKNVGKGQGAIADAADDVRDAANKPR